MMARAWNGGGGGGAMVAGILMEASERDLTCSKRDVQGGQWFIRSVANRRVSGALALYVRLSVRGFLGQEEDRHAVGLWKRREMVGRW